MRRGEIWWVDLPEPRGSEPGYTRPGIIVSADSLNASAIDTVTIVFVYSNLSLAKHPGNVALSAAETGLDRDSVANITQIKFVARLQLLEWIGTVPPSLMAKIDAGLRLALHL